MKNVFDFLMASEEECVELVGNPTVHKVGSYAYWDNGAEICLVAHVDTIKRNKDFSISSNGFVVSAEDSVLGADDRAGVYAIYKIAQSCNVNILLTYEEECGGRGVKDFIKDHSLELPFKEEQNLFIELDRQGANEFVCYSELSDELKEWAESFGWVENYGSYSDVADLTDAYCIPHINLSVGYYNQHSKSEILVLSVLNNTINTVIEMLNTYIPIFPLVEDCFDDCYKYLEDDYSDFYKDEVIILDNGREMKLKDYYKENGWI